MPKNLLGLSDKASIKRAPIIEGADFLSVATYLEFVKKLVDSNCSERVAKRR